MEEGEAEQETTKSKNDLTKNVLTVQHVTKAVTALFKALQTNALHCAAHFTASISWDICCGKDNTLRKQSVVQNAALGLES